MCRECCWRYDLVMFWFCFDFDVGFGFGIWCGCFLLVFLCFERVCDEDFDVYWFIVFFFYGIKYVFLILWNMVEGFVYGIEDYLFIVVYYFCFFFYGFEWMCIGSCGIRMFFYCGLKLLCEVCLFVKLISVDCVKM